MSDREAVVGASSGVGRALAEALAGRGADLVLVASDRRDPVALAGDLSPRRGAQAHSRPPDLADPSVDRPEACGQWVTLPGQVDVPFCRSATSARRTTSPSPEPPGRTVRADSTGVVAPVAESALAFERQGGVHIVGFSSIAAAAPRRRTTVHAPAKAALEACLRALRHDSAGTPVVVQVYALGYVDTAPTFGKDMGVVDHLRYRWLITRLLRPLPWRGCGRLRF